MKILDPTPRQAAALVEAMHAVVTARGTVEALPVERESLESIQRHLMRQPSPLVPVGTDLPPDLEDALDTPVLRRQAVRFLAILSLVDRRAAPAKVAVVLEAAARLSVSESGLRLLQLASEGRFRRVTFELLKRFVNWWSPTGRAGAREWLQFLWWMLPMLHGERTNRKNRDLAAMRVDLLAGWDLWTAVDLPLESIRRDWGVSPLSAAECARLAAGGALNPA